MENASIVSVPQQVSESPGLLINNFQTILSFIPEAIFILDFSTGRIVDANDAMIGMYGYGSKGEILQRCIGDLCANTGLYNENAAKEHIQITIEKGHHSFDWLAKRKDCTTFWVEMKLDRIDIGGKKKILAIARDIDQQKKLEEKFRHIVELSTHGMYSFDLQNNIYSVLTDSNPETDRIFGASHQNAIGKTIEEIFNFTAIADRRDIEVKLEEQAKELREISAMKDKFMSIIAHDLKSPFNAITGFADLMIKSFDQLTNEDLMQGLTTIHSASTHAYKLLENLMVWAQNQSGKINFLPEILKLKKQVNKSLNTLDSVAKNKGIQIKVDIISDCQVFADENMLDTIIRNLVSNAIKFSHKGSKIIITASETDQELQISIADQGIGINPERLSAIFEIDKRSNTTGTDNEQGTGFGLILCKEFIAKHQGKIWVESTPGTGSIFTFSIPKN